MDWPSVYLHEANCVSPLGLDLPTNWERLTEGHIGIVQADMGKCGNVFVGKMAEDAIIPRAPTATGTLLEHMMEIAAAPLVKKYKPTARTALVLSTTKGNISLLDSGDIEGARVSVLAKKIAARLGIHTKPVVVSHACISGLLAVIAAKRLIQMGQYDDAIVLAGDVVSEFVVSGFQAFQAMSPFPCRPFDKRRHGVSLGEAAACVYMSREKGAFKILGDGAINDANHISGPSRTGEGLCRSIAAAVQEAGIDIGSIDYISAHGTATLYNDEMESVAFSRLGLEQVPLNSLKGYYGHTLGASGLLELAVTMKSMEEGVLLPTQGFGEIGVSQPLNVLENITRQQTWRALKTASGFGGSNAAMIIERR